MTFPHRSPRTIPPWLAICLCLAAGPVTFFAVLTCDKWIDACCGYVAATTFISDHQDLVQESRNDQRIHTFQLLPHPERLGDLLIVIDVDDLQTFKALDRELDDAWSEDFQTVWKVNVRSGEEIHTPAGLVVTAGFGAAVDGFGSIVLAGATALLSILATPLMVIRWNRRQSPDELPQVRTAVTRAVCG